MKREAEGTSPSTNGGNGGGRDAHGRFTRGNSGGPGNPHVKSVAAWRSALARVILPADIEAVLRKLLECAKAGEPWAIKELLDRCLGKPRPEAERPDGPEQPGILRPNVDLGLLMAQEMRKLSVGWLGRTCSTRRGFRRSRFARTSESGRRRSVGFSLLGLPLRRHAHDPTVACREV
jgi:hypothetical protein